MTTVTIDFTRVVRAVSDEDEDGSKRSNAFDNGIASRRDEYVPTATAFRKSENNNNNNDDEIHDENL